jgi:hypothetical protein
MRPAGIDKFSDVHCGVLSASKLPFIHRYADGVRELRHGSDAPLFVIS